MKTQDPEKTRPFSGGRLHPIRGIGIVFSGRSLFVSSNLSVKVFFSFKKEGKKGTLSFKKELKKKGKEAFLSFKKEGKGIRTFFYLFTESFTEKDSGIWEKSFGICFFIFSVPL